MAVTNYAVNHPLARKHWSDELVKEALQQTQALKFMGTGSDSIIQVKDDTQKGKGDKVTFGLRVQLTGDGVADDGTLEGNEEALSHYSDSVLLGGISHAVRVNNFLGSQRVPFEVRNDAKTALADWLADRIDTAIFNQLAGATQTTDTRYTGSNATIAPEKLLIWDDSADANHTAESSLSESDVFTLRHIDFCIEKAKTLGRSGDGACPIRPIKYKGEELYVMFAHPIQVRQLRQRISTTTGPHFYDLHRALLEGGQGAKQNPIFSGASFMYNNTIVHESTRVPYGQSAAATAKTTYRRAIFCGAQAATMCFGKGYAGAKANWVEESFDYNRELGVSAQLLYGVKKCQFNSKDFGVITVPTYASAAF